MKLNTTNVNTIKSAILELFKHQLLPDPKPIHEFFQLTPTEFEKMLNEIVAHSHTDSTILVMSNGGFNGIHQKLLDKLHNK